MQPVIQDPDSPLSAQMAWDRFVQQAHLLDPSGKLKEIWLSKLIPVALEDDRLILRAPAIFFAEYFMSKHRSVIDRALWEVLGEGAMLDIVRDTPASSDQPERMVLDGSPQSPLHPQQRNNLNPKYRFDNYIEGDSNRFALAAARSIAESPLTTPFNPYFVYGGSGYGKTHLIQAIGDYCIRQGTLSRVIYITSEQFINQFIESIKHKRTTDFAQNFRNVDMLILDDIQFIMGKERTQTEFFHTFNSLYQAGKKIILSSDRPPKDLEDLDERLTSRFASGLVTELTLPDYETRVAILTKRADEQRVHLDSDVVDYIASHITTNVRDLEGALIQLIAQSSLLNHQVSMELVKKVVRGIAPRRRYQVSLETIAEKTAAYYGMPLPDLKDRSRKKEIASARQVAMYICHKLTRHSLRNIALHFGRRDHSTVIHAVKTVEDAMNRDNSFRVDVEQILHQIDLTQ